MKELKKRPGSAPFALGLWPRSQGAEPGGLTHFIEYFPSAFVGVLTNNQIIPFAGGVDSSTTLSAAHQTSGIRAYSWSCSLPLAPYPLLPTPCSLPLAPCPLLPAPCSLPLAPCPLLPAPCPLLPSYLDPSFASASSST